MVTSALLEWDDNEDDEGYDLLRNYIVCFHESKNVPPTIEAAFFLLRPCCSIPIRGRLLVGRKQRHQEQGSSLGAAQFNRRRGGPVGRSGLSDRPAVCMPGWEVPDGCHLGVLLPDPSAPSLPSCKALPATLVFLKPTACGLVCGTKHVAQQIGLVYGHYRGMPRAASRWHLGLFPASARWVACFCFLWCAPHTLA